MSNKNMKLESEYPLTYWISDDVMSKFKKFFTNEEINKALENVKTTLLSLTDVEDYENGEPTFFQKRELVEDWHSGTVKRYRMWKGLQYEADEQVRVQSWRTVGHYQDLETGKIMTELLRLKLPFFNKFKWTIYEPKDSWYIFLDNGKTRKSRSNNHAIYLTLETLFGRDINMIIKDNTRYWEQYCSYAPNDFEIKEGDSDMVKHNKRASEINWIIFKKMFKTRTFKEFSKELGNWN